MLIFNIHSLSFRSLSVICSSRTRLSGVCVCVYFCDCIEFSSVRFSNFCQSITLTLCTVKCVMCIVCMRRLNLSLFHPSIKLISLAQISIDLLTPYTTLTPARHTATLHSIARTHIFYKGMVWLHSLPAIVYRVIADIMCVCVLVHFEFCEQRHRFR